MPEDLVDNSKLSTAFWLLAIFSLVVVGLTLTVTTEDDWVNNLTIELGNEYLNEWCDKEILSSSWCSKYQSFEGMQTTAAVLSGIGMFFLFLSCCVPHPQTVEFLSGTIFMLHAIAQASAIGILTMLKDDFYDAITDWDTVYNSYRELYLWGEDLPELTYGNTFWVAIAAMTSGVIESVALFVLSRKKS